MEPLHWWTNKAFHTRHLMKNSISPRDAIIYEAHGLSNQPVDHLVKSFWV